MPTKEELKNAQIEEMKKNMAPIEEDAPEEPVEQTEPEEEPEAAPVEQEVTPGEAETEDEPEADEPLSERENALLKEISRLKKGRREEPVDTKLDEIVPTVQEEQEAADVTPAEARLFTSWRDESLAELIEAYPQYSNDPKLWARFLQEYSERVPEVVMAKRNKLSITKSLFKDRLMRVHKALGESTDRSREEGKKDLLKAQAAASVMGAGNARSSAPGAAKPKAKENFLRRTPGGMESWKTKK